MLTLSRKLGTYDKRTVERVIMFPWWGHFIDMIEFRDHTDIDGISWTVKVIYHRHKHLVFYHIFTNQQQHSTVDGKEDRLVNDDNDGMDVVEWSRALDVRLSEWCCNVSMAWVQIPSKEEQQFDSSKI